MSRRARLRFRLFVAGDTQNSAEAIANLSAFCGKHLPNRHEIEIVDVIRVPERAMKDSVFMTPTLVKLSPSPLRQIVGTLSDPYVLLQVLGLRSLAP
jgi:circadian clock protein KaiB